MKNRYSLATVCFGWLIILAISLFYYPKWQQSGNESTIGYDVAGYYEYLPAIFIYKDLLQLQFQDSVFAKYKLGNSFPNYESTSGNKIMKYPAGAAIMYLPWFTVAHVYAKANDIPADGFSKPYQTALSWGCLLYVLIGLLFVRKVLLHKFNDKVTAITILLLIIGTNYLNYASIDNAMTHSLLFTLFSILLWLVISFYKSPRIITAIFIGALIGLATITRPSEIVICIIPIFWGVFDNKSFMQRLQFFRQHIIKIIFAILSSFAIISIQLLYWKYTSGNFIEYSYGEQGFDFKHPFFYEVLFTFRKGWLVYTPLMLFIIPGFVILWKKHRDIFWSCFLYFILTLWIVASWEIWWYGGSLGQRALVQSYAVLIFPLAATIESLLRAKLFWKIIATAFIIYSVSFNLFLTWQAHAPIGIFEAENMNRAYFWKTFYSTKITKQDKLLLDKVDINKEPIGNSELICQIQFEEDSFAIAEDIFNPGNHARIINSEFSFYNFTISKQEIDTYKWLHISMMCFLDKKEWDLWKADQIAVWFKDGDTKVKTNFVRIQRIADGGYWVEVYFDAEIPKKNFNSIEIAVMNLGSRYTLLIDNIQVKAYD
ncbi:MAG: hypothetical protein KA954_09255 [Chitinophagales bacterium]|nr:hypothetical protein [Chitinophagales bacterium]MBP9188502.1 hypothetical protein [Chitinophagales bacterium]MBP9703198.1 hypothetical protein [Chitinophagales bacterium]